MDDSQKYGEELYRLGFSEAVQKDLLSDYKVIDIWRLVKNKWQAPCKTRWLKTVVWLWETRQN